MLSRSQSAVFEDGLVEFTNESGCKYYHDRFIEVSKLIKKLEEMYQSKPGPRRAESIRKAKAKRDHYRKEWY